MNTFLNLVLATVALLAVAWLLSRWARGFRRSGLVPACNTNPANFGTHAFGKKTFLSSAAIATRWFLVKKGADAYHAAVVAATADEPIGICNDQPAAAELEIGVEMLGVNDRTVPVVAGGAIANDADLYSDGTGKVIVKPTAAGTYWKVGKSTGLTANAADGEPLEMIPQKPRKLIVVSALASTNGTAAGAADLAALKTEAENIGDDLRKIAAALNGDADVALATT